MKVPNPNDYTLFANSGWDGNWYVGYNTCWVKKLPPVPLGSYARAYIGARLGRMKMLPPGKRPWEQKSIPGEIWIALSSTASWTNSQQFKLTSTDLIPSEGDPSNAVVTVGESQWFWTEVPVSHVNVKGDNFLALWSPTPGLVTISSSPVLAAAWGGKEMDTWLDHSVKGTPSQTPEKALATGLSYFQPAMALKLIPAGAPAHPVTVRIVGWHNSSADHPSPALTAVVTGDSIERAWVEFSTDEKKWTPVGRPQWKAPYTFSVDAMALPQGRVMLRVVAANVWEETGASAPHRTEVSKSHEIRK